MNLEPPTHALAPYPPPTRGSTILTLRARMSPSRSVRSLASGSTMSPEAAPELARIPPGDFLMGAADGEDDERPVHAVYVSEFFIGRFAVTQDEYARFVRATGYPAPAVRELPLIAAGGRDTVFRELAAPYVWTDGQPPAGRGSHPVVLIRYEDAVAYCSWLSQALGRVVRLPTEAEWEKAARGGVESAIPLGRGLRSLEMQLSRRCGDEVPAWHTADGHVSTERLRAVRHVRQRVGVGLRLVRQRLLRVERTARSVRARTRYDAHPPRRIVGERGCRDAAVCVSSQSTA